MSEVSRLRKLLSERGDYWDLRWDLSQLESAWRMDSYILPPLGKNAIHGVLEQEKTNTSVVLQPSRLYFRQPVIPKPEPVLPRSDSHHHRRYRVTVDIVGVEGMESVGGILALHVVRGNPLELRSDPLPCLATGTGGDVNFELVNSDEIEGLCLQIVFDEVKCHLAVPLDTAMEEVRKSTNPEERKVRKLSLWDMESGTLRGTVDAVVMIYSESAMSYAELMDSRLKTGGNSGNLDSEQPPPWREAMARRTLPPELANVVAKKSNFETLQTKLIEMVNRATDLKRENETLLSIQKIATKPITAAIASSPPKIDTVKDPFSMQQLFSENNTVDRKPAMMTAKRRQREGDALKKNGFQLPDVIPSVAAAVGENGSNICSSKRSSVITLTKHDVLT